MKTSVFFMCICFVCTSFCQENLYRIPSFPNYFNQHKDTLQFYFRGSNSAKNLSSITKEFVFDKERFVDSKFIFNKDGVLLENGDIVSKLYERNDASLYLEKIYTLPEEEEYRSLNPEGYCLEQEFFYNKKQQIELYKKYYANTSYDEISFTYNVKNQLVEKITKLYHGVSTDSYGTMYLQENPTTTIIENGIYKKGQLVKTTFSMVVDGPNHHYSNKIEQTIQHNKNNLPVKVYKDEVTKLINTNEISKESVSLNMVYNLDGLLLKTIFKNENVDNILQVDYKYCKMGLKHLKLSDAAKDFVLEEYLINYDDQGLIKTINFSLKDNEKGIYTYNYY